MDQFIPQREPSSLKYFLTRHVTAIDIIASIVIVILVMSNVFFALRYVQIREELRIVQQAVVDQRTNSAVVDFMNLFIERVLKAETEIDFETRLALESSVRSLNDDEILIAWERFTGAETEKQAQTAVKNLLGILTQKIQVRR